MKRLTLFGLLLAILLVGCSPGGTTAPPLELTGADFAEFGEDVLVIGERVFVAQVSSVFMNLEQYLGRTVRYEGGFKSGIMPLTGQPFYYVVRYGPGCCGPTDGLIGFEVAWPGGWPEGFEPTQPGDWVEVIGVFELYDAYGFDQLRVSLLSLTVQEEGGSPFVTM